MRLTPASATDSPRLARRGRWLRAALGGAGAALVVALIARTSGAGFGRQIASIVPLFLFLVALYTAAQLAFCLGWWAVLADRPAALSFSRLFSMYLAGDCLNYVSPGNVGGEPVRAGLLAAKTGAVRATASVAIHRYAELCAQSLLVAAGLCVMLVRSKLPAGLVALASTGLLVLLGFLLLLGRALAGRTPERWRAAIASRARPGGRIASALAGLGRLEEELSRLRAGGRRRFLLAVSFCFAGWCGGLVETYLILRTLSPGANLAAAVGVEVLCMLANTAVPFVPAKLGTADAARLTIAGLVAGISPSTAAVYAVTRRGREIAWAAIGAVALAWETSARRSPASSELG